MENSEIRQVVKVAVDYVMPQILEALSPKEVPSVFNVGGIVGHSGEAVIPNFPPYEDFVRTLFKKDPSNVVMAIHAAIGIAGESGELREATSFKNAIEEIGDMKFYTVAMRQRLSHQNYGPGSNLRQMTEVTGSKYVAPAHATVVDNLHILSCALLDLAKKSWVYGRDLPELDIWVMLELIDINLDYLVEEFYGTSWGHVTHENQAKLIERYKGLKYSDEAALARADKT